MMTLQKFNIFLTRFLCNGENRNELSERMQNGDIIYWVIQI